MRSVSPSYDRVIRIFNDAVAENQIRPSKSLSKPRRIFLIKFVSTVLRFKIPVSTKVIKEETGIVRSTVTRALESLGDHVVFLAIGDRKGFFSFTNIAISELQDLLPLTLQGEFSRCADDRRLCVGGRCQTPGCEGRIANWFRGRFRCRECMIGGDLKTELETVRAEHREIWGRMTSSLSDCDKGW